jgi:D-glycero-alpha-D-manno-heptose-7-phosphate kinase
MAAMTSVAVHVPVRTCDVGGWTDTWFAQHGRVCSLAVGPGVTVLASTTPGDEEVIVDAADYGVVFRVGSEPPEHRLLAEAVREAGGVDSVQVHLRVASSVPPSASLGTSASVCVGLIAALDAVRGTIRSPGALASAAHRAEARRLGRQSGVQDQFAAAHGGVNLVDITRYPEGMVRPVAVSETLAATLDARLAHIVYGSPHDSSAVHEEVIAALTDEGPSSPRLERLRRLADEAAHALGAADLSRYGNVLTAATAAQATLHPALISDAAAGLIEVARSFRATGWKVNGAAGRGGSISVLARTPSDREGILEEAQRLGHTPLAIRLAPRGASVVQP